VATIKGKEVKFSNHQSLLWEFQKSRPTTLKLGASYHSLIIWPFETESHRYKKLIDQKFSMVTMVSCLALLTWT